MGGRSSRRKRSPEPGVVVLGQDLARATDAEKRHRAAVGDGPSPLQGVGYDAARGEHDLHRFVESPVDQRVESFVAAQRGAPVQDIAAARSALRMDDLYTLIAFARRCALAAVSGRGRPSLDDGVRALLMIDEQRLDWRDLAGAAELLAWAMSREGRDHQAELRAAASELGLPLEPTVASIAQRPANRLEPAERLVTTPLGVGFANTYFHAYAPTVDLVSCAFAVQDVLEADVYRVASLTVEADLPEVWLSGPDDPSVADALAGVVAGVDLDAELDPTVRARAADQQLTVFIAEASDGDAASVLAEAARPTERFEALGLAVGPVVCVVVARSIVVGVKPYEQAGALMRFSDALRAALSRPAAA